MLAQFLTAKETAAYIRVAPRTLRRWRQRGTGPRFVRAGRAYRYAVDDVAAWLGVRP